MHSLVRLGAVAIAHDENEQRELSQDQIPDDYLDLMPK